MNHCYPQRSVILDFPKEWADRGVVLPKEIVFNVSSEKITQSVDDFIDERIRLTELLSIIESEGGTIQYGGNAPEKGNHVTPRELLNVLERYGIDF